MGHMFVCGQVVLLQLCTCQAIQASEMGRCNKTVLNDMFQVSRNVYPTHFYRSMLESGIM